MRTKLSHAREYTISHLTMLRVMYGDFVDIWLTEVNEPIEFGEDGGICVSMKYNKWSAFKAMRDYQEEEWGIHGTDLINSINDIGISYLHPPSKKDKIEYEEDITWVISSVKSPFPVYAIWG